YGNVLSKNRRQLSKLGIPVTTTFSGSAPLETKWRRYPSLATQNIVYSPLKPVTAVPASHRGNQRYFCQTRNQKPSGSVIPSWIRMTGYFWMLSGTTRSEQVSTRSYGPLRPAGSIGRLWRSR